MPVVAEGATDFDLDIRILTSSFTWLDAQPRHISQVPILIEVYISDSKIVMYDGLDGVPWPNRIVQFSV